MPNGSHFYRRFVEGGIEASGLAIFAVLWGRGCKEAMGIECGKTSTFLLSQTVVEVVVVGRVTMAELCSFPVVSYVISTDACCRAQCALESYMCTNSCRSA
jgi:hypothetical protein